MKWKLLEARKETEHPFLNFYTLVYDVEDENGHREYSYFMASRHDANTLLAKTGNTKRPDGVLIPLYYQDPETGKTSFLLTRQFRPAVGHYVTSMPAGLLDEDDDDLFECVRREAKEEAGALVEDIELLCPAAPTSSGLSDELDAVCLARIVGFEHAELEAFEDIQSALKPREEVVKMLQDPHFFFPLNIRMILLYLLERFPQ